MSPSVNIFLTHKGKVTLSIFYEQIKATVGDTCTIRLNTDELTFEHKDKLAEFMVFTVARAYPNLLNSHQQGWDNIFSYVNQFFATLPISDQTKIAKTFGIIHHDIIAFFNNIDHEFLRLTKFTHDLGAHIVALDQEIADEDPLHFGLCDKLRGFVVAHIPIGDCSTFGTRPQDTEELTFHEEEIIDLITIAVLCKMLTPIFGVMTEYLKRTVESKKSVLTNKKSAGSSKREIHCVPMLTPLFKAKYNVLIDRLHFYIKHTAKRVFKDSVSSSFCGLTDDSMSIISFAQLMIRNFVNVDLNRPKGNLMTYIVVTIKKSIQSLQSSARQAPVYPRVPMPGMDGEEGNQAQLEIDSLVSNNTFDVATIITTAIPKVIQALQLQHEITPDDYQRSLAYYRRNLFVPTKLNKFLTCSFYSKHLAGGKSVLLTNASNYMELVTMLQLIVVSNGYTELGHMLTAKRGMTAKTAFSESDFHLQMNYKASYEYKNCASKYEQSPLGNSSEQWDTWMESLVTDIVSTVHTYNTSDFIWETMGVDSQNGKAIAHTDLLFPNLCGALEHLCGRNW